MLALRVSVVPPTINLENPDPDCDLDYVPHTAAQGGVDLALSNSFGFGGTNGALLFRRGTRGSTRGQGSVGHISGQPSEFADPVTIMKIAVCIKQVPTREWQPRLNDAGTGFATSDASYELNEPDAYALEEGLRLREKHGGEVVVCAAGPRGRQQVIREALARGADRAIHVEHEELGAADASGAAGALAEAMRDEAFDSSSSPACNPNDQGARAGRSRPGRAPRNPARHHHHGSAGRGRTPAGEVQLEGEGRLQWVALPLPAVLTIQSGINQLRYATLKGIMASKKKEIRWSRPPRR